MWNAAKSLSLDPNTVTCELRIQLTKSKDRIRGQDGFPSPVELCDIQEQLHFVLSVYPSLLHNDHIPLSGGAMSSLSLLYL